MSDNTYYPKRKFNGQEGYPSSDDMGPEVLSGDIDEINVMFNPTSVQEDGSPGGISKGNLNFALDAEGISFEQIEGIVADTVQDAIAEVFGDLEEHIDDKNNPHETTAEKVPEDVYGSVQAAVLGLLAEIASETHNRTAGDDLLRDLVNAVSGVLAAHKGDYDNPHRVTSEQVASSLFGDVETGLSELLSRIKDEADTRAAGDALLDEMITGEAEARVYADTDAERARLAEEAARKAHDKALEDTVIDLRRDLETFMNSFGTRTWQEVLDNFATWNDVLAAGTWLKVYLKSA
jgi:hypothetical protein